MIASELIKILQQNPDKEVVIVEFQKYDDNIPLLPIHSVDVTMNDDGDEFLGINFITHKKQP